MSVYANLEKMVIVLPKMTPVAAFAPWVRADNLLHVSRHIAKKDGVPWIGQLGGTLTTEKCRQAALHAGHSRVTSNGIHRDSYRLDPKNLQRYRILAEDSVVRISIGLEDGEDLCADWTREFDSTPTRL
jgi:hypothetical protein